MSTQFLQIPRKLLELKGNTKFLDILVYSVIETCKTNGKSRIAMQTISEKYKIPYKSVELSIRRLEKEELIKIDQHKCENSEYVFNEYSFPLIIKDKMSTPYIELDPTILSLELAPKDRGVLIALHLLTEIGINQVLITTGTELAGRLGITRQTASKYLKKFTSINEISISKCGFINVKYIVNAPEIKPINNEKIIITL